MLWPFTCIKAGWGGGWGLIGPHLYSNVLWRWISWTQAAWQDPISKRNIEWFQCRPLNKLPWFASPRFCAKDPWVKAKYLRLNKAWWFEPIIPALKRMRQEANKFKDSLDYRESSTLALRYIVGLGLKESRGGEEGKEKKRGETKGREEGWTEESPFYIASTSQLSITSPTSTLLFTENRVLIKQQFYH